MKKIVTVKKNLLHNFEVEKKTVYLLFGFIPVFSSTVISSQV